MNKCNQNCNQGRNCTCTTPAITEIVCGTLLRCRETGDLAEVTEYLDKITNYRDLTNGGVGVVDNASLLDTFEILKRHQCDAIVDTKPPTQSQLDRQVGGEHYKELGAYQPWQVLQAWLTPEEFRGYMKGTALAYLARERSKGGDQDVLKGTHTLQALIEMAGLK